MIKRHFDLYNAFVNLDSRRQSRHTHSFLRTCAGCSELPSNISTMARLTLHYRGATFIVCVMPAVIMVFISDGRTKCARFKKMLKNKIKVETADDVNKGVN